MDLRLSIERLAALRLVEVDRVILDSPRRNSAVVLFERREPCTDITLRVYVTDTHDDVVRREVRQRLDPGRMQNGWLI